MFRKILSALLVFSLACGGSRHTLREDSGIGPDTVVYDAYEYGKDSAPPAPPPLADADFRRNVATLAEGLPRTVKPEEYARKLLGRPTIHIRVIPLQQGANAAESSSVNPEVDERMTREYLQWCAATRGGGDCLGLVEDGPVLRGDDKYVLALCFALSGVLDETLVALKDQVQPQVLLNMLLWTATIYLLMWTVPEPVSKGIAATLTAGLLVVAGWEAVRDLFRGFTEMVVEVDQATTFSEVSRAGNRLSKVVGRQVAQALVAVALAVLSGTAPAVTKRLNPLPAFRQAALQSEAAGGVGASHLAVVEQVAMSTEGEFILLARNRTPPTGGGGASGPKGPRRPKRPTATTLIRHRAGNQLVEFNGQTWHVPAHKNVSDIPTTDVVGDRMQAATREILKKWGPGTMPEKVARNIKRALNAGKKHLALIWEGQARGRYVEAELREQFKHLKWSERGVDAVDLTTGIRYEVCSGTFDNMARHGRRMPNDLFRLINF